MHISQMFSISVFVYGGIFEGKKKESIIAMHQLAEKNETGGNSLVHRAM